MENIPDVNDIQAIKPMLKELIFMKSCGFKAVYKGKIDGMYEAIKAIYIPSASNDDENIERDEMINRVKREFEVLDQIESEYLVKLGSLPLELIPINNFDYLLYSEEWIEGESLRDRINRKHNPDEKELLSLLKCMVNALIAILEKNYIHRDIKPGNIMATQKAERPYVLLDLGIAYKIDGTNLTAGKIGPGTIRYIAPELLKPDYRTTIDIRSDIYSLGVTLFEYACLMHPFLRNTDDMYSTIYKILNEKPTKLSQLRQDLPDKLCSIIDRCIKKLPALRYPNPKSIILKMEELL